MVRNLTVYLKKPEKTVTQWNFDLDLFKSFIFFLAIRWRDKKSTMMQTDPGLILIRKVYFNKRVKKPILYIVQLNITMIKTVLWPVTVFKIDWSDLPSSAFVVLSKNSFVGYYNSNASYDLYLTYKEK